VRYRCPPATAGRVFIANSYQSVDAWVVDLSVRGAGLLVGRALEPDVCLLLELEGGGRAVPLELGARVIHCARQADGDWLVGCAFHLPLSDEDLEALL
jgi:hypothetical protein